MEDIRYTSHFDFHNVFTSTKKFIDDYNKRQDKIVTKLNSNHRATAEYIVRLYLKQLNKTSEHFDLHANGIPGFKTFNSSLAKLKGCTSRTVINHRERLRQAGFIVEEVHLGAQGIELFINPQVLLAGEKVSSELKNGFLRILPLTLSNVEVKNFHPLVHEHQEQNNNNSIVDSELGVRQKAHQSGQDKSMPTGTPQEQNKNTKKDAGSVSYTSSKEVKEMGRIFLINFVSDFWEFARKILFPQLILSEHEERDIKNMIWASVYNRFEPGLSAKDWVKYQEQALERIVIVKKWLDRSPHHWIPPAHIYFNPNNQKNGFQRTIQWLVKRDILKLELQKQLVFQKIQHEQKLHSQGKGRQKALSRLQLYRMHEQRLQRINDPVILQAYYKQISQTRLPS